MSRETSGRLNDAMSRMRCAGWRRAAALAVILCASTFANAHAPSNAYLQLSVQGATIAMRMDIALRDLDRELVLDENDDGALSWGEVRKRWPEIEQMAQAGVHLTADGKPCTAGPAGTPQLDTHSDGRHAVLTRTFTCPAMIREVEVGYTLFADSDATHRGILRITSGGGAGAAAVGASEASAATGGSAQERVLVLVPGASLQRLAINSGASGGPGASSGDQTWLRRFADIVAEGIHHILIGTDHVLFLLALLLPAVLVFRPRLPRDASPRWIPASSLRDALTGVVKVVTAFTVAHSLTLALAVLGWVQPPTRLVESLIAVTVALAAVDNLWPFLPRARWKLSLVFGLVHGFGFATALQGLGLSRETLATSLLGFNLGVEIGQLGIVAVLLPLAWWGRGTVAYRRIVLGGGSVLIAAIAIVWFIERAMDLKILS